MVAGCRYIHDGTSDEQEFFFVFQGEVTWDYYLPQKGLRFNSDTAPSHESRFPQAAFDFITAYCRLTF